MHSIKVGPKRRFFAAAQSVIDGLHDDVLRGWAWFPRDPEQIAIIVVKVDGHPPFQVAANRFRNDLMLAGKRGGYCGFEAVLVGAKGAKVHVSILNGRFGRAKRLKTDGLFLTADATRTTSLPQPFTPDSGLRGFVEICGPRHLEGWAFAGDGGSADLAIFEDDCLVATIRAEGWRSDVAQVHDNQGRCGFNQPLPETVCDGRWHLLDVRRVDTGSSVLSKPLWTKAAPNEECAVAERPLAVEHVIDGIQGHMLVGWAWFPEHPERAAIALVEVEGQALIRAPAAIFRNDLAIAGKRRGYCAFEVPVIGNAEAPIRVGILDEHVGSVHYLNTDGLYLPSKIVAASWVPQSFSDESGLQGFIDTFGPTHIEGWAIDSQSSPTGIQLGIYEKELLIATFHADIWREDVAQLNCNQGHCGFVRPLPEAVCDGQWHLFDIRRLDTGISVLSKPIWTKTATVNEGAVATPTMEYSIEGINDHMLRGWIWFPQDPERAAIILVEVEGQTPIRVTAKLFRSDLAVAGKRQGHCAFEAPLVGDAGAEICIGVLDPLSGTIQYLDTNDLCLSSKIVRAPLLQKPFSAESGLWGFVDKFGPTHLEGWAIDTKNPNSCVNLALFEEDRLVAAFIADAWRADLAQLNHNQGCCGFVLRLPESVRDGEWHLFDIRRTDTDSPVLPKPLWVAIPKLDDPQPPPLLRQDAATDDVFLSIIVNFYNMPREAARTLTSLTRTYQQIGSDFPFEVICIDNGSEPPIDPEWVKGFGPEFRLMKPSRRSGSPCLGLNEAAMQARGRHLGVMIDGAHVLTPGVFRETAKAWREDPEAVIALRYWFIGGDQRWLAEIGYQQQQEDLLFERIKWPSNGYEMFRIGTPIGECSEPWFDGIIESNCLLLPTSLYDEIGGFDESFDEAGGGFANLDLWRRAADRARGSLVALIGEATFHQFHGGTTTNVSDMEKDSRVRSYAAKYQKLRGKILEGVGKEQLLYRGRIPSEYAMGMQQRSLMPLTLSLTDRIRPAQLNANFILAVQDQLQAVYAEGNLREASCWLRRPTGIAPGDLINLQEIMNTLRPDGVVMAGVEDGLVGFVDSMSKMLGLPYTRLIRIGNTFFDPSISSDVLSIQGSPEALSTHNQIRQALTACENVLVLYSANSAQGNIQSALDAYGKMVSHRSWLICLDVLLGQPWLGYSTHHTHKAVHDFISKQPGFVIDLSWNRHLISTSPEGYLRKIGDRPDRAIDADYIYDPALDNLPIVEGTEAS